MSDDIVDLLREEAKALDFDEVSTVLLRAAAEIEGLRMVLRTFVEDVGAQGDEPDDWIADHGHVTWADIRRARAALQEAPSSDQSPDVTAEPVR